MVCRYHHTLQRRFTLHFESMLSSDTQVLSQKSPTTTAAAIHTHGQSIPRTPLADISLDATGIPDAANMIDTTT